MAWRNVCGYEINVFLRIRQSGALFHSVTGQNCESGLGALAFREARFHLHTGQFATVLYEKIVGMAVAVWFGDTDALAGCAIHECQFGEFAHAFGAEVACRHVGFCFFQRFTPVDGEWSVASDQWLENTKGAEEIRAFIFVEVPAFL